MIGDLGNEFGPLPDSSEEKSLADLGTFLSSSFAGKLGKHTASLVAKMFSSKMPAGFNLAAGRDYLKSRWGLGSGRQTCVLLMAMTSEPASRLGDGGAARAFFDSVVDRYAVHEGVTLSTTSTENAVGASAAVAVDAATLDALQKDQTEYLTKQLKILAKFLKVDLFEHQAVVSPHGGNGTAPSPVLGNAEHGEAYESGIMPMFDPKKVRRYDSWWNWARQAAISLFHDIQSGTLPPANSKPLSEQVARISNRSHPALLDLIEYLNTTTAVSTLRNDVSSVGQRLYEDCQRMVHEEPLFTYKCISNRPKTVIEPSGVVKYSEIPRGVHSGPSSYVSLLRRGSRPKDSNQAFPLVHLKSRVEGEWRYDPTTTTAYLDQLQLASESGYSFKGKTALVTGAGAGSIGADIVKGLLKGGANVIVTSSRSPSAAADVYLSIYMEHGAKDTSLTVLPFNQGSVQDCENLIKHIYDESTGLGQDLDIFIPFAAISEGGRELDRIDDRSELAHRVMLVNLLRLFGYIKTQKHQRGFTSRPTQIILPLSPNHGIFGGDGLYSESKLGLETIFNRWSSESWGAYLTICGAVIGWTRGTGLMNVNNTVAEAIESHDVITFSQREMALNILGLMAPAVSLMCQDDPVFADLNGGLQFIPDLKKVLNEARASITETSDIRKALLNETQLFQKCLHGKDTESIAGAKSQDCRPRANLRFDFPALPDYESTLEQLSNLKDMVDLSRVVVVVGYSELGPWGNARTRWEMEAFGEFSREGFVEMAWIMGLIRHFDGQIQGTNTNYTGWVDSKTGEAVHDDDIGKKYRAHILEHSGIRIVEPDLFHGYDPTHKELLQEIAIEEDLEPFDASKATAEAFVLRHGDKAVVTPIEGTDECSIALKRGATLLIPKSVSFDRLVAGQIPSGWDPRRYGIADDIVSSIDPITIYALCAVAEALLSAGITDPYEIYQYIHISEIGNCIGSGAGGVQALRGMYRDRWMDLPVQKNVLQETFINTIGAWVNMLLLGSSGPIKSPVGACATAIEALDIGAADVISGKVKMCLVGGTDDFNEEMSQEFANMQATSSTEDEFMKGREPGEMSRPTASTRSGFMESQGSGIQLIANAELALQMGLPIYGIIASTTVASDKIGRSVPAPGQGILTNARETPSTYSPPLLDISYRRKQMELAERETNRLRDSELRMLFQEPTAPSKRQATQENEYFRNCAEAIERATKRGIRDIKYAFGNNFAHQDPAIAPLRAALAVWNLTIDDIDFVSMHGTSTVANDKNESDIIDKQMKHLGRSKGNPVIGVFQKSLTGHPKGGAGAWMLNGALQALNTGIIPGNRNADNIDGVLRKYETIVYPNKTIKADSLKAFSVTSFGFGQKGGQVIGVHPRYVLATIGREAYEEYRDRRMARQKKTYPRHNQALMTNTIFQAKSHAPYSEQDESNVFLDPNARVSLNKESHLLSFVPGTGAHTPITTTSTENSSTTSTTAPSIPHSSIAPTPSRAPTPQPLTSPARVTTDSIQIAQARNIQILLSAIPTENRGLNMTVGVDVEEIANINPANDIFVQRNFTHTEQEYAKHSAAPQASLAARWCAKEAVFKSLGVASQGGGAPMRDIEIVQDVPGKKPAVKV